MDSNPSPNQTSSAYWESTDRLDSWKEIASYLRREVRTVQLWEKKEGLPIHRHFHQHLGSVFAFRSELDRWKVETSGQDSLLDYDRRGARSFESLVAMRVLPLENLTGDSQWDDFCRNINNCVTGQLKQLHAERMVLLTRGVERFSEDGPSTPQPKRCVYDFTWTVEPNGSDLRLRAQLKSSQTKYAEWSKVYEVNRAGWRHSAEKIAEEVRQCLWLKIVYRSRTVVPKRRGEMRAREAYLKGRYFWELRSKQGLNKAVQLFKAAIQADPSFALAHSGLADALTLLSFYEILPSAQIMPLARKAALKAVELNPNLAEAHASLADVMLHFDRDWHGAEHEYRLTIQCNPDYALGYHWYSNLLAARRQHDAARLAIMSALEIDPVSIITLVWAGVISYLARDFDAAIGHYRSALELDSNFVWAHMYLAQALEQKGELQYALREFETAIQLAHGNHCLEAMRAHTLALAGDYAGARENLRCLTTLSSGCLPSFDIAATYAALGEPNRMVAWLNRACHERSMKLFTLPNDPRFDSFRRRDDFKEVVAIIGLAHT